MEETKTILDWFIPMILTAVLVTCSIWHPYVNKDLKEYSKRDKIFFWAVIIEFGLALIAMTFEFIRLKN